MDAQTFIRDIAYQRLHNQHLAGSPFPTPEEAVRWLGAVQAQDYPAAKWAVAQRTAGLTDAAFEQEFTEGAILRTHILRPTWHFVTPDNIRWMLALTAPRVHALNAHYYRQLELDEATFRQSEAILAGALEGGKQLARPELAALLQQAGLSSDNLLRFSYLMMHAELEGLVCSGAWRGKQPTYALLAERAPQARTLDRDDALAELARRYFVSHGPATLDDYRWWSGLTAADARAGLDSVKLQLVSETVDGVTYWFAESSPALNPTAPTVYLLPNYDEYLVSYTDRSAMIDPLAVNQLDPRGNILFSHTVVVNGRVVGTWKRAFKKGAAILTPLLSAPLTADEQAAFAAAVRRYGDFLGLPVVLA